MALLTWFDRLPRPLVIAHRGSSLEAPENTIAAFQLAVDQGAHAIELDVTTCASDDLVVIHDTTVNRTTNGRGKVTQIPLKEIKSLDAGSWFSNAFSGENVPTLDEVFETVGMKCFINVELKNYTTPFDYLAEKVALAVIRHKLQERIFFSSFNPLNFRKIKKHLPDSPVGLLTMPGKSGDGWIWLSRLMGPFDALHPHYSDVSQVFIKHMHKKGMPVFAYTLNDAKRIQELTLSGIDGVITDNPGLALEALQPQS